MITQDWVMCRDALIPAIEMLNGTHTEDDILGLILAGHMRLWRVNSSAIVTHVLNTPRMRILNIFLAGGDLKDLMPLQAEVEKHARENDCSRLTALAVRPGWQKIIPGGIVGGTSMYKDL